jgi:hypothetical protein
MNINPIQLIGQVEGVVNGALSILRPTGQPAEITLTPDHLVVQAAAGDAADRVAAVIGALSPTGDRKAGLAALYPHLPTKALDVVLGLADGYTAALENDGVVDTAELMDIGMRALKGVF